MTKNSKAKRATANHAAVIIINKKDFLHCQVRPPIRGRWQRNTFDQKKKSNPHYTRGITPKRVTIGGDNLRGFAPGQHDSKETSQRWRAVGHNVSDLTGEGIVSKVPHR